MPVTSLAFLPKSLARYSGAIGAPVHEASKVVYGKMTQPATAMYMEDDSHDEEAKRPIVSATKHMAWTHSADSLDELKTKLEHHAELTGLTITVPAELILGGHESHLRNVFSETLKHPKLRSLDIICNEGIIFSCMVADKKRDAKDAGELSWNKRKQEEVDQRKQVLHKVLDLFDEESTKSGGKVAVTLRLNPREGYDQKYDPELAFFTADRLTSYIYYDFFG